MEAILGNLETLLISFGYAAIFAMVFAESGLFFGFFLPGDSLLFTSGLLASQGYFSLPVLLAGIFICAVLGDQTGYWMGSKFGKNLFNRPKSFIFNPEHVSRAEKFYEKHGKKTIVLARFVPIVRTFAPIVAGIAKMDRKTFTLYNVAGGAFWTLALVLGGFFLGKTVPDAGKYLEYIVAGIIILSLIPVALELLKSRKQ